VRGLDDLGGLRALARVAGEGFYVSTLDGTIVDGNAALLELFGVTTLEELRGIHAEELYADPDRRRALVDELRRHGVARDFDLWLIRPDGELRSVRATATLYRNERTGTELIYGALLDVTRQRELETQLLDMGMRDALTGCYNRRYLADLEARLAERGNPPLGVVFIDVDHFKQYNDRYGHHAGDAVLTQMARFLRSQLRGEEAVVRVGGDEFLLALVGAGERRTELVARSLEVSAPRTAPAAFSLGWAVRAPGEMLEETIKRADRGLLQVRVAARSGAWPILVEDDEEGERR
jgi:diguanylate cyclase (GGDEF)-like protein/PAS domain S-box-containing protein